MPTPFFDGKEVQQIELLNMFPATEGMIAQYYGRIGSGKTYNATSDILDLLRRGKVVYANWRIHYEGTDERKSFGWVILSLFLPWRRRFYNFPSENLKYFEFSDKWAQTIARPEGGFYKDFTDWLSTRTDCYIFGDEGHVMFDSYQGTRMSIDKRTAILHTRHFNRTICIISQRPTAIHVAMRANVNVFYKCEQIWSFGPIVRFKRSEYQDMMNESVDEDEEKVISVKWYWGKTRVFEAYDTKYLRGDMPDSQKVMFKAYDYGFVARLKLLWGYFFQRKDLKSIPEISTPGDSDTPEDVLDLRHVQESSSGGQGAPGEERPLENGEAARTDAAPQEAKIKLPGKEYVSILKARGPVVKAKKRVQVQDSPVRRRVAVAVSRGDA